MQRSRVLFLVAAGAGGCAGAPPDIDPAADAALAVALPGAVAWRDAAGPLDAAPAAADGELTVEGAVRAALLHDPVLQQALAEARAALADADQARRWPNPLVDVAVRMPSGGGPLQFDLGLTAEVVAVLQ